MLQDLDTTGQQGPADNRGIKERKLVGVFSLHSGRHRLHKPIVNCHELGIDLDNDVPKISKAEDVDCPDSLTECLTVVLSELKSLRFVLFTVEPVERDIGLLIRARSVSASQRDEAHWLRRFRCLINSRDGTKALPTIPEQLPCRMHSKVSC